MSKICMTFAIIGGVEIALVTPAAFADSPSNGPVITQVSATPTSITFGITNSPSYTGAPQEFTYEYADSCAGTVRGETGTTVDITCPGLKPATGYTITVAAISANNALQGITIFVGTTTPAAPVISEVSSTSTSVTWTATTAVPGENVALSVTYYYSGACTGSVDDDGTGSVQFTCSNLSSTQNVTEQVYAVSVVHGTSPVATFPESTSTTSTTIPVKSTPPSTPKFYESKRTKTTATAYFDSATGSGEITYHYTGTCAGTVKGIAGQLVSSTCKVASTKKMTIRVKATNAYGSSAESPTYTIPGL